MVAVGKDDLGERKGTGLGLGEHGLGERMAEAVEVGLAGAAGQLVATERDVAGKGRADEDDA